MTIGFAALMLTLQVTGARVTVAPVTDGYTVTAVYSFDQTTNDIVFSAIRWPGQGIVLNDTVGVTVTELRGLTRITPVNRGLESIRISYEIRGRADRIPIFVPNVPTQPGSSDVSITVRSALGTISVADAFPRFTNGQDGSFISRPANLPSFLLLPNQTRLSRARMADGLVVFVLLCASGLWVIRRTRSAA